MDKPYLVVETSSVVCSVCIARHSEVLTAIDHHQPNSHAAQLVPAIEMALAEADLKLADLGALCFSMGPGSYTGLRIGLAALKGISMGSGVPLFGFSTLQAIAGYVFTHTEHKGSVLALIDARRMDAYAGLFSWPGVINKNNLFVTVGDNKEFCNMLSLVDSMVIAGTGIDKVGKKICEKVSPPVIEVELRALHYVRAIHNKQIVLSEIILHGSEPLYIKPAHITTPKS